MEGREGDKMASKKRAGKWNIKQEERSNWKWNQNCEEKKEYVLIPGNSCWHRKYDLIKSEIIWENFQFCSYAYHQDKIRDFILIS